MYRSSFDSINHTILRKPLLNTITIFNSTYSSSSSLQTLTSSSQPKSISNPLYNFLPQTLNPNNLVNLITSHLKHNNNSDLALLQNDLNTLLPHLGTHEISRVLLRCQSDSSAALTFFNWVKIDLGIKPSCKNYCFVVHILAWNRKLSQSIKLLSELIEVDRGVKSQNGDLFDVLISCTDECNWDPVVLDMLVKAYVRARMIPEGLRAFTKVVEVGFVPNVITVNCLLNGLSKSDCFHKCWDVYQEMGRIGIHPNSFTFNILTHALCKEDGEVDKVNEFLEKMEEEGFDLDIVTYNTLISNYCRKGRLEDAFYLYKIMYLRNVIPDLVTYTSLMNGLCKKGKMKEGHQIFHRMVHRGLNPDVVSYNTLISGYCKEGKTQESKALLHDMISNGICPDSFTIRTLVEGYCKEGRLISALNLVVELRKLKVSVCSDIYDYLIVSLCNEKRPFAAKSLLDRIFKDGYEPNLKIYNELIDTLCKHDSIEDALVLKDEMVHRNVKPNSAVYAALIRCLCRSSRNKEGEDLMKEMIDSGLTPGSEICKYLVNGYCKQKNVGEAESVLRFFATNLQVYDVESYNALVRVLCENGDVGKSIEVQDKMMKIGYTPNSLTCKYMMHGLRKSVELNKHQLLGEGSRDSHDCVMCE